MSCVAEQSERAGEKSASGFDCGEPQREDQGEGEGARATVGAMMVVPAAVTVRVMGVFIMVVVMLMSTAVAVVFMRHCVVVRMVVVERRRGGGHWRKR